MLPNGPAEEGERMQELIRPIGGQDVHLWLPDEYARVNGPVFECFETMYQAKKHIAEGMVAQLGWAFLKLKANEAGGLTIHEIDFDRPETFRWKPRVRYSVAISMQQVKWYRTLGRAFPASARELALVNAKALDDEGLCLTRDSRDRDGTLMVGSPDHPAEHADAEYVSAHLLYRMLPDLVHLSILERGWGAAFRGRAPIAIYDQSGAAVWLPD